MKHYTLPRNFKTKPHTIDNKCYIVRTKFNDQKGNKIKSSKKKIDNITISYNITFRGCRFHGCLYCLQFSGLVMSICRNTKKISIPDVTLKFKLLKF